MRLETSCKGLRKTQVKGKQRSLFVLFIDDVTPRLSCDSPFSLGRFYFGEEKKHDVKIFVVTGYKKVTGTKSHFQLFTGDGGLNPSLSRKHTRHDAYGYVVFVLCIFEQDRLHLLAKVSNQMYVFSCVQILWYGSKILNVTVM